MRNELFSRNDILVILITLRDFRKQVNHFGNGGGVPVVNEGNQNSIPLYLLDLGPIPNPVLPPGDAPGFHFPRGIVNIPVPILVKSVIVAVQDTRFAVTEAWSSASNLVLLTPCDVPVSHFPRGIVSNKPVPILVKCVAWSPAPNLVLLTPCDVTARVYKLQIFARN